MLSKTVPMADIGNREKLKMVIIIHMLGSDT